MFTTGSRLPSFKTVYPDSPWKSPAQNDEDRAWLNIDAGGPGAVYYTTGPGYPGPDNTYIPYDLSGRLRIWFSRAPAKFHFPKYWQYVESPNTNGYYLKITSQEASRVVTIEDFEWPDGAPDRASDTGTESFNFIPFKTDRKSYKFNIGDKAATQAVWPIIEQHGAIKAAQCMTARSVRGLGVATTPSLWQVATNSDNQANLGADHTANANAIPGVSGYLDQGTATSPYFKNALGYIADLVNQDTLGVIDSEPDTFFIIINPKSARLLAASPEIHQFIANSYWAKEELAKGAHPNGKYGLPSSLYGYQIIVENCVRTTSRKGATLARSYAMPNQQMLVCSRIGGIEGTYGAPSFSTLTMFYWKDEMTVETKKDSWDRITYGRVVEDPNEAITCTASGFLVTQAFSS